MVTLTQFYENHFGFRYADADSRPFSEGNYYQWRDYEFPSGETVVSFGIAKKLFASKADARRKLKDGAVRIGLNDEKTPFRQCAKLTTDRPIQSNDFIRVGLRCFGIIPKKPTLLQNIRYLLLG